MKLNFAYTMFTKSIHSAVLGSMLLAAVIGVGGCGSGGSTAAPGPSARAAGSLRLTVLFPAPLTRAGTPRHPTLRSTAPTTTIPVGTNAVKVRVTASDGVTDLAQPQIIPRPTSTGATADATFAALPAGPALVFATAYADIAATEPLAASDPIQATIQEGAVTTVNVPLKLGPVDHVVVTPGTLNLSLTGTSSDTLNAVAENSGNNQLPGFPMSYVSSDPNVATVTYDPNNSSTATVTAVAPGQATITVTEINSSKSAPVTVNVVP